MRCRWHRADVLRGAPFAPALPRVYGFHVAWAKAPFRRGFGWALEVRTVGQWAEFAEPLLAREPVGRLAFWPGTLDDWHRIAALYTTLAETTPSPIIELNRAVAVSFAHGPQAGLDIVDTLTNEPSLKNYHLLPSVRGDLLVKLNRPTEARTEFERASTLTRNTRERDLLLTRAASCETDPTNP